MKAIIFHNMASVKCVCEIRFQTTATYLTFHKRENTIARDRCDSVLINGPLQHQSFGRGGHVTHLMEQPLASAQIFLHLVFVEAAELLKTTKKSLLQTMC